MDYAYNKYIDVFNIEKNRLIYILDRVKLCEKTWQVQFTDFLTPEEAISLASICNEKQLTLELNGGRNDCERVIGAISNDGTSDRFPIKVLKIIGNLKFENLNHRDYLGAVLSLGIRREKVGDINVFDDGAEIYLHDDIASYIELNLTKIKHTGIKTKIINVEDARDKIQSYKEARVIVTSMRIDCVVAALINISRAKASELIRSGVIKVNHTVQDEVDYKVKIEDLFSIKGFGRYKVSELSGKTKSDRQTLIIKKYI